MDEKVNRNGDVAVKIGRTKEQQRVPYPKSVFFIVSNEFCERFSFYGMRTILSIYLVDKLLFSESTATVIFHAFVMMVYFFPVFGAILADSLLGKFRTILYVSIVYAIGNVVLALAATPPLNFPIVEISLVGLALIAVGTGGIKPCVAAFGGDQYILPQQEKQLETFFSWFYFSINAGSLLSIALTPILRKQVKCFDEDTCYSLAFAVPGVLMILSVIIFALGKPLYIVREAEGNMIVLVSKCIGNAVSKKIKSKGDKKDHWLDYAEEEYGAKLVKDIKAVLKVLFLYIPLPIFWALYDQQGSGWTFMARRMDGDVGFYSIPPEQIQIVNPILVLSFIPLFTYVIYPLLGKCGFVRTPLQRLVAGGCLAAVAFVVSGLFCLAIEDKLPILPSDGNGQIRIYNGFDCDITLTSNGLVNETVIKRLQNYTKIDVPVKDSAVIFGYNVKSDCTTVSGDFKVHNKKAYAYYFNEKNIAPEGIEDDVSKNENAKPNIRLLINRNGKMSTDFDVRFKNGKDSILTTKWDDTTLHEIIDGEYTIHFGDEFVYKYKFRAGGGYSIVAIATEIDKFDVNIVEFTEANSVHSLLLLPQYILMTMGEVMFSVTGLEFAYSQAPTSMKSVLQACWLLTTAFGNLIIIIIEAIGAFDEHSKTFFLYAALMLVDMIVFALMAMQYTYVTRDDQIVEKIQERDPKKKTGFDNIAFKNHDE